MFVGSGVPSVPRVSIASDPTNDKIYAKTSEGALIAVDAPPGTDSLSTIYWRQKF